LKRTTKLRKESKPTKSRRKVATPAGLTKPHNALEVLRSRIAESASFFHEFTIGCVPFRIWPGMNCSNHTDATSGVEHIRLENGSPDAPSGGHTGGYSIRLPDTLEAAASGRHVAVSVVSRGVAGAKSRFALSYSTNEVGNTGWRWQNAGPEWAVFTIEYDVPTMKQGRGDFVGILADKEGHPGIEICYLSVSVTERPGK